MDVDFYSFLPTRPAEVTTTAMTDVVFLSCLLAAIWCLVPRRETPLPL